MSRDRGALLKLVGASAALDCRRIDQYLRDAWRTAQESVETVAVALPGLLRRQSRSRRETSTAR